MSDVIKLPRKFHDGGNASIYSLLQDSGYFAVHDQVTEGAIQDALLGHPELVRDWMDFSEAKRTSSGWFLRRGGGRGYQVGHYPDHEPVDYSDEVEACAAFIKREIEDIRTDGRRTRDRHVGLNDEPRPHTKAELDADLSSGNVATIATALVSAALHDPDREYVESLIVKFIRHDDPWVRSVSATAAGHVARIHRQLSAGIVPLIADLLADERTCGKAQDALDDIRTFLRGPALN